TAHAAEPTAPDLLRLAREALAQRMPDKALALVEKAIASEPKNPDAHFGKAHILAAKRDFSGALKSFDRVVELAPNFSGAYESRGETHFKIGHIAESINDFDQFIRLEPSREPHHWQRGISYYYAGKFAEGKRQFEIHQKVNPQDVENAVWHFLCNARLNGVAQARKDLIVIEQDVRVPMKQVHALFAGRGTAKQVLDAVDAGDATPADRRQRRFFAHLYLGLYFEATGDAKQARAHIEKAVTDFSQDHFMGDVARVHLQLMNKTKGNN
ncbi:MAG TPA: tetratricopeptide repeat protein, partial [Verrucomicrobiae bacterium]